MRGWYARSRWARGTVRGWRPARPTFGDVLPTVALVAVVHFVTDIPAWAVFLSMALSYVALDMAVYRLTHPRDLGTDVAAEDSTGETAAEVSPGGR